MSILKKPAISTDRELKQLILELSSAPTSITTVQDLVDVAMGKVTVAVAEELLKGTPLLLPDVYDLFCSTAAELSKHLHEDIDIPRLATSGFILSSLTATLQHHMKYSCNVKKFGTLLFRSLDLAVI